MDELPIQMKGEGFVASTDALPIESPVSCAQVELEVVTPDGLHMRVASKIAQLTREFQSAVEICLNGTIVNAKSLIDLLTLAAEQGSRLLVTARGEDCVELIERLLTGLPPEDIRAVAV